MYKFLVGNIYLQFLLVNFSRSKCRIVNNTRNTLYLGQNTSKYRSQVIVVYVHAHGFLYSSPSFSWVRRSFPDYLEQLKCDSNRGEFSVFSSVVRLILETTAKLGETLTQSCAEKYEFFFCTLPHEI